MNKYFTVTVIITIMLSELSLLIDLNFIDKRSILMFFVVAIKQE